MIIVLILFILFSLYDYKRAVFVTASTLMFTNNLSSGIPGVKLFYAVAIIQVLLYYLQGFYKKLIHVSKLLLYPAILLIFSYFISNYVGVMHSYAKTAVNVIAWFFYPYVVYQMLHTRKDVMFFGKSLCVFFFFVGIYALVELSIGYNVYSSFAEKMGIIQGELGGLGQTERFGFLRCNSFLPYSSALGMNSALIFSCVMILKSANITILSSIEKYLLVLLPVCVLLCGTRSQFVVFIICLIGLYLSRSFRRSQLAISLMLVGIIIAVSFMSFFQELAISILSPEKSSVGGSSIEMRLLQFEITEYYWSKSPWFGLGRNFTWEVAIPQNPALLGAESIVFTQLMDHGLVGLLLYYTFAICLAIWCYKYSESLAILPIAFIVGKTLSTVVGVEYNIPIILCLFVARAITLFKGSKKHELQYS